jgi:hypothetical protein
MSNADATAVARAAAVARWGDRVLRRSVDVVLERADMLSARTRAELEQIADRSPAPDREK